MKQFALLIKELDQTTKTNLKVEALERYFEVANDQDKLWALALLSGRRPKRTLKGSLIAEWSAELANIPGWLWAESYHIVGDLAEAVALLLPDNKKDSDLSLTYWIEKMISLGKADDEVKKVEIQEAWSILDKHERFVFNKLITGGFRIGVSQQLVTKALAKYLNMDPNAVTHRLMGNWSPTETTFHDLLISGNPEQDISRPYPFFLAYALDFNPSELGTPRDWQAEWKWDGIRGQIIKRKETLFVWSRGEDLITDKFPEFKPLLELLPEGTVIDGEIMAYRDGLPLSFNTLQTRIGRKNITSSILKEAPVALLAYDLLEFRNEDIRSKPLAERRKLLEILIKEINSPTLALSSAISFSDWEELARIRSTSRENNSEGLMLKKLDSVYETGRRRGKWWKWKIDPLTIDAVLIYAQRGHGRRADLYTDYTFAVWEGDKLVPFAKAYSGLTDAEIIEVDRFIKKNTVEKFGPVRSVKPELVFELAFEGIASSPRHKSGVALRFPRMARWRKDKPASEADTLENLKSILKLYGV